MAAKYKASLKVNGNTIELTEWPEQFLTAMMECTVANLKKTEAIKALAMSVAEDGKVDLTVNGKFIPLSPFPNAAMAETFGGLVKALKGVDEVKTLDIEMQAA